MKQRTETFVRSDGILVTEEIYPASMQDVWNALTREEAMREWYFPQLIHFEPRVGFKYEFRNDGSAYQKEWLVIRIDQGCSLTHTWTYVGFPGYSEVTFQLFAEGDQTRLKVSQTGIHSFPNDPHFAPERFAAGWRQILGINLKKYLSEPWQ